MGNTKQQTPSSREVPKLVTIQMGNRQLTPIDSNLGHPLRMRRRSIRSIRVHWRSFAVDLNSYQNSNTKLQKQMPGAGRFLGLGAWGLVLLWCLEFGIGSLGSLLPGHLVPHFINTATLATRDFWPSRGASDAHTLQGSVRSEQRRRGQKEPSAGGLRRFWVLASLLLGHSPTSGDAPSSRLARTQKRRNQCIGISETLHQAHFA